MRRRTLLRAGALGLGTALSGCLDGADADTTATGTPTATATDGPTTTPAETAAETATAGAGEGLPRLSVDGRWLTDPDGRRVVPRGVNTVDPWWGREYADLRGRSYDETLALALDRDAGWQTNIVRIPVEPRTIDAVDWDRLRSAYLDPIVARTREAGVYCIIDYHAIERYDTAAIDRRVREFWSEVAPRYAEESHVLFELFNEPTEPYGDGIDDWRRWKEAATPWVEHVREMAPETPILVGSPRWTSMTRHAATDPFEDDNIVYTAHIYPSSEPGSWEDAFGAPAEDVPVFVSEWGYIDVDDERTDEHMLGSTSEWGEPFREWLDGHANVGWTAWCFDSIWMPRMFDDDWQLLGGDSHMGEFTKRWLAETGDEYWPPGRN